MLEWGHYFGLPSLVTRKLFGRWILVPQKWNLGLTRAVTQPAYAEPREHPQVVGVVADVQQLGPGGMRGRRGRDGAEAVAPFSVLRRRPPGRPDHTNRSQCRQLGQNLRRVVGDSGTGRRQRG